MNSLKRFTKSYTQKNHGTPKQVFPLLCPERECDWLDGWDYEMIYSESGFAEKGCVFSTSHHGNEKTIWYVTVYDPINYHIEFVRVTPNEELVKINIHLIDEGQNITSSEINYEFTPLNQNRENWLKENIDKAFLNSMKWWEESINHYLNTGKKLMKIK